MTISELIKQLELAKTNSGDIEVRCVTMSHSFPPDLLVKRVGDRNILILNS